MSGEARPEAAALGLGERLRSARKAKALSVEEVAETLHLEERIVRALEDERYASLGAPVFVRGHLRSYARLLGLSEQSVLEAYRKADPSSEVSPRMARVREQPVRVSPGVWSLGLVAAVAVLVVIVVYVLQDPPEPAPAANTPPPSSEPAPPLAVGRGGPPAVEPAASSSAATPAVPAPEAATEVGADPATLVSEAPETGTPAVGPAPAVVPEPEEPAAPEVVAERAALTIFFDEASWVEVTDRDGRKFAGEQPAGSRRDFRGEFPFRIVLGNAPGVRILANGVPVSVPTASIRRSNVARFQIEAPAE